MVFPIAGGTQDTAVYEISNSLRFNDGDSPYLSKTPSSAGNRRTFTISLWAKRGDVNTSAVLYGAGSAVTDMFQLLMQNDGDENRIIIQNRVSGTNNLHLVTTNSFRDVSAWYHIVLAVDTTQSTSSNRAKLYVNGNQMTVFNTETYPSQDYDCHVNNTVAHHIGAQSRGSANDHFDGYIAELYSVDGSALGPTTFGKTNTNGVWVPINASPTFGTNGFFMEFKQNGSGTDASGRGADTSGNDNHFANNNFNDYDTTTDTPTNNFCTMNPLGQGGGGSTIAEGNLKETTDDNAGCPATFAVANGKWYWEIKIEAGSNNHIGIADADSYDQLASSPNNYRITLYQPDGRVFNMGSTTQGSDSGRVFDQGDIMGIRLDLDSGTRTIKWYEDDTLIATENIGAAQVLLTPFAGKGGSSQTMNFNFGNPAFSISSGNSDANGYGNFEYAVPSGHYALCTKNLAEYG
tara:strand:- start:32 stop:1417 length:1386 start_codon:yes stop_codon:yes gene_type:complete